MGQERLDDAPARAVAVDPHDLGLRGGAPGDAGGPGGCEVGGLGQPLPFLLGRDGCGQQPQLQGDFGAGGAQGLAEGLPPAGGELDGQPVRTAGQLDLLQLVQHRVGQFLVAGGRCEVDGGGHLLDHGRGVDLRAQRQEHRLAAELLDQRLHRRQPLLLGPA